MEGGGFKGAESTWLFLILIMFECLLNSDSLQVSDDLIQYISFSQEHRRFLREELPLPSDQCLHSTTDTVFGFHSVKMHFLFYSSEN